MTEEKYINPFTDYGFKRLFGEEPQLEESIFEHLFEVATLSKFTEEEAMSYENSLKYYRDLKNSLDTSFEEGMEKGVKKGRKEGREEGKAEQLTASVLGFYQNDVSIPIIAVSLGITESEVQNIIQNQ